MYEKLGQRIRSERQRRHWTQSDLQQAVRKATGGNRLSRTTLSEIENGRYGSDPSMGMIEALATVLETTTDYLIGLSDDPGMPDLPRFPVPASEIIGLVASMNRLTAEMRRKLAAIFLQIAEEVSRPAEIDQELAQLERIWRSLEPERRDALLEGMLAEVAEIESAGMRAARTADGRAAGV